MGATNDYPCLPSYHEKLSKQLFQANKDCKRICWKNKLKVEAKHNFTMDSLSKPKAKREKRKSIQGCKSMARDVINSLPISQYESLCLSKMLSKQRRKQEFLNIENPEKDQLLRKIRKQ